MDGGDIIKSFIIIIIFIGLLFTNILAIGIKHIQNNWNSYKCSPVIMPFASVFGHDPYSNFTDCVQNMNLNFMQYLLDPINFILNTLTDQSSSISDNITGILGMGTGMSDGITSFISNGFSIVTNLYIIIETIIIKIRDTFNKLIGIITTILFILGGMELTARSIWDGPIGGATRLVAGAVGSIV